MKKEIKKLSKFWLLGFGVILVGLVIYNSWQIISLNWSVSQQEAEAEEVARPAQFQIILLEDPNCSECTNLQPYLDYLSSNGGQIDKLTRVELNSTEGQALLNKYQIKFLPSLIVKGELNKKVGLTKFWSANGQIVGDSFILRNVPPPYTEVATGLIKGLVSLIKITDPLCKSCYEVDNHLKALKGFGVKIIETKEVTASSAEGKALIDKYNIRFLPTIILSPEVAIYPRVEQIWPRVGVVADDGSYVFTKGVPQMGTYEDLATGQTINPTASSAN